MGHESLIAKGNPKLYNPLYILVVIFLTIVGVTLTVSGLIDVFQTLFIPRAMAR
jgi:hypothetical protein